MNTEESSECEGFGKEAISVLERLGIDPGKIRLRCVSFMKNESHRFSPSEIMEKAEELLAINLFLGTSEGLPEMPKKVKAIKRRSDFSVRWDAVRGSLRKKLKFMKKNMVKSISIKAAAWNRHVGKDVLYVRTKLGGGNWMDDWLREACLSIVNCPRFIERTWEEDNPYCTIYFDISGIE